MNPTTQADAFARILIKKNVDPNEVAKSFTQLRVLLRRAEANSEAQKQAAKEWWTWLDAINGSSGVVVLRSKRTQDYYAYIRDAANSYLQGMEPTDLAQALGWGVRMMRYYRNLPDAMRKASPFGAVQAVKPGAQFQKSEPKPSSMPQFSPPAPKPASAPQVPKPIQPPKPIEASKPPQARQAPKKTTKSTDPTLPEVGDIFTSPILGADETAVLVEIKGFDEEKAIGFIRAKNFAGKRYQAGNLARVEVIKVRTQRSGRVVIELKPDQTRKKGKKKKKKK